MKLRYFSLLILFILLFGASGASALDWHLIPTGIKYDLQGLCFANENDGYAVSKKGTIYRFRNVENRWQIDTATTGHHLEDIYILRDGKSIAVGDSGMIIRSRHFGHTWNRKSLGEDLLFYDLIFFDTLTGIVIGTNYARGLGLPGVAYRTVDGGVSWDSLDIGDRKFNAIALSTDGSAMITANQSVFISQDEGLTWRQYQIPKKSKPTGIAAHDGNAIIVGMSGFLALSNDGGQTWRAHEAISRKISLFDVIMIDSVQAYAVGSSGWVLYSDDAGQNWIPQPSGAVYDLLDIQRVGNRLYACGKKGTLVYAELKDE